MNILIDLKDVYYEGIKKDRVLDTSIQPILMSIKHGVEIPDNATNGDVLKRLLYGKAIMTEFIHDVNISVNNNVIGQFDREWWNAPYKRGETE